MATEVPYSELAGFLERLGFDPANVREFTARPSDVKVTIYERNAEGEKFCDPDSGEPATQTLVFTVGRG